MSKNIFFRDALMVEMSGDDQSSPDERRLVVSFSSETPYWRDDFFGESGYEVLGHGAEEVDIARLNAKAPVMLNHYEDSIGVVDRAWVENGRGYAEIRLSRREDVSDLWRDIQDGIISSVSVGYRVNAKELVGVVEGKREYRVTRWEPLEISILNIPPADYSVGIGRAFEEFFHRYEVPEIINDEDHVMTKQVKPVEQNTPPETITPAVDLDAVRREAVAADRARVVGIKQSLAPYMREYGEFIQARIDDGLEIDAVRAALLDEMSRGQQPIAGGGRIESGEDAAHKRVDEASDWLLHRAAIRIDGKQPSVQGNRFRGMRLMDLARHCVTSAGHSVAGLSESEIITRAVSQSSSDFPVILENTLHKTLLNAYTAQPDTWRAWCAVGSVSDFRAHPRIKRGAIGNLSPVTENGEYTNLQIPDGKKESVTAGEYGNLIGLTRKMIIDDDMQVFSGLASDLGRAAARSIESAVYTLLVANPTMNEDSTALFHANHSNLAGSGAAISVTTLDTARAAMKGQKDVAGKEYLDIMPWVLLVPTTLEGLAKRTVFSEGNPADSKNSKVINEVYNMVSAVVDSPRLSGTAWYVLANPAVNPVIEVAFLNGNEAPYLEMQDVFNMSGVQWKVRHDWGVAAVDYRGAYKNPGA